MKDNISKNFKTFEDKISWSKQKLKSSRQSESNRRPKDNRDTLQSSALPLSYDEFQYHY